jgi:N6-L-threonylcarbamoyladenine synthase
MRILAIETSCDDTCAALVEVKNSKFEILSNIVSSQVKLHAKYGGVYPSLAKREHQKNLPHIFKKAVQGKNFHSIGVTAGPGLEPCLWQGINFAKEIAEKYSKPLIPVNHVEAHILANFIGKGFKRPVIESCFPAVCLVVSGGHTQLILMRGIGKYQLIGETRDDAAGECFDKTARILGLGYPGGPIVAAEALKAKLETSNSKVNKLPRPMIYTKDYDFSFSGLKTAVLYEFKKQSPKIRKSKAYIRMMSVEIQQAIIDVLIYKTIKAAKNFKVRSIVLGGGVAANKELRGQFKEKIKKEIPSCELGVPEPRFCTDNAVITAVTAHFKQKENPRLFRKTKNWQKIKANANLRI